MSTTTMREPAYHAGERFVQERTGERKTATSALGAIHASIPNAARAFLEQRSFVVIAAASDDGSVWCTQLGWHPKFMHAVDERTLRITSRPLPHDPMAAILDAPVSVGTIAIDFATHRRMRLTVAAVPSIAASKSRPSRSTRIARNTSRPARSRAQRRGPRWA